MDRKRVIFFFFFFFFLLLFYFFLCFLQPPTAQPPRLANGGASVTGVAVLFFTEIRLHLRRRNFLMATHHRWW